MSSLILWMIPLKQIPFWVSVVALRHLDPKFSPMLLPLRRPAALAQFQFVR
jgi:hypothetical protein